MPNHTATLNAFPVRCALCGKGKAATGIGLWQDAGLVGFGSWGVGRQKCKL